MWEPSPFGVGVSFEGDICEEVCHFTMTAYFTFLSMYAIGFSVENNRLGNCQACMLYLSDNSSALQ